MNDRTTWLRTRVRAGWLLVAGGLLTLAVSLVLARAYADAQPQFNILGGLGIFLGGIGAAMVIRYRPAISNDDLARRLVVEERDERGVLIRQRAGQRAFWVSAALVFVGLMWTSFAANGRLPALEGDGLWNFLAAAFVLPMAVYVGSVVLDEHRT